MSLPWIHVAVRRLTFAVSVAVLALHASGAWAQGTPAPHDTTQAVVQRQLLKTRSMQINAYPYVYYTPETELAFGAGGITTFYTSKEDAILRPSKISASGYYSTKKQYKFTVSPQLYFARNQTIVTSNIDYGFYVDKFWGIGNETPDQDEPEYESKAFGFDATLQLPPLLGLVEGATTGFIFDLYNSDVVNKRENAELQTNDLTGTEGGASTGLGVSWTWDTRDQLFYPTHGRYHQLKSVFYGSWLGGDFDFNRYDVDLREYVSLKPKQILALQVYAQWVGGNPPFYEFPALGGQRIMRGYYQGRYRDEVLAAAQAEYRGHIKGRFGFVAFAAVGDVGSKLTDVQLRELKTSLGGGLRVLFNKAENVNLRVDAGFGRGTSGIYFGLEEAF